MNLVNGRFVDHAECVRVLDELESHIHKTLLKDGLNPQVVIEACDKLAKIIDQQLNLDLLFELGIPVDLARSYLIEAKNKLSKGA